MSIEQRLEDLTTAIKELPGAIASVLENSANPLVVAAADQPVKESKADPAEGKQKSSDSEDTTKTGSNNSEKSEVEVAGRKTYVFNKAEKTGQVVEKGEELPQGDEFTRVAKTKWEQLCEKYGLDPQTGSAAEAEEEDEDFDDLDDAEEEGEQEESGEDSGDNDDDDDLGLDDDEDEDDGLDPAEVKKRMIQVMKEVGRETALKVFKKYGARNFDEVKKEDIPALYETAGKVLKKHGK